MHIRNLSYKKLDFTMMRYASFLYNEGYISLRHSRRFWELPYRELVSKGTPAVGDVGISNYFPFSLLSTDVRKNFVYYSTHGLRSENLIIKLKFTEPLAERWYMIIVSEFLVSIKFDTLTGAPTFKFIDE